VAWMFVCCKCCVLWGRGLCDELITRPEESYRLWCVVVCDLETSRTRRPWPALGRSATEKNLNFCILWTATLNLLSFYFKFLPNPFQFAVCQPYSIDAIVRAIVSVVNYKNHINSRIKLYKYNRIPL
jgi:hypothetical protein